jgi:hypothetical protein
MWKIVLVLVATAAFMLLVRLAYDPATHGGVQAPAPLPLAYAGIRG